MYYTEGSERADSTMSYWDITLGVQDSICQQSEQNMTEVSGQKSCHIRSISAISRAQNRRQHRNGHGIYDQSFVGDIVREPAAGCGSDATYLAVIKPVIYS